MVLDFLPYKLSTKPRKRIGWIRYKRRRRLTLLEASVTISKSVRMVCRRSVAG